MDFAAVLTEVKRLGDSKRCEAGTAPRVCARPLPTACAGNQDRGRVLKKSVSDVSASGRRSSGEGVVSFAAQTRKSPELRGQGTSGEREMPGYLGPVNGSALLQLRLRTRVCKIMAAIDWEKREAFTLRDCVSRSPKQRLRARCPLLEALRKSTTTLSAWYVPTGCLERQSPRPTSRASDDAVDVWIVDEQ